MLSTSTLPLIALALLIAVVTQYLLRNRITDRNLRLACFAFALTVSLVPLTDISIAAQLRGLLGDLSITSVVLLSTVVLNTVFLMSRSNRALLTSDESLALACIVAFTGLFFYPTTLGLTQFDPYAAGFYPVFLSSLLLSIVIFATLRRWYFLAFAAGSGMIAYAVGMMDSNNLWDYVLDPWLFFYCLYVVVKRSEELTHRRLWASTKMYSEQLALSFMVPLLLIAAPLASINPDYFRTTYSVEDGVIEWCTVLALLCGAFVCAKRMVELRSVRNPRFLTMVLLLTLFCLFGAGEEISWGQRIIGLETPEYFTQRNTQEEIGFHNMKIRIGGKDVKINKLVFGTGLAVMLLIYLFVVTPAYRRHKGFAMFVDSFAVPMPRNYQIAGYLAVVLFVELAIESSKRGEMTEFAGSIIFALNIIYPYNPHCFDPKRSIS